MAPRITCAQKAWLFECPIPFSHTDAATLSGVCPVQYSSTTDLTEYWMDQVAGRVMVGFSWVVAGGRRGRRVHISLKGPFTRGGGKRRNLFIKRKEAASSAPVALEVYNLPPSFRCKFSHNPNHLQSNPHQWLGRPTWTLLRCCFTRQSKSNLRLSGFLHHRALDDQLWSVGFL